MKDKTNTRKNRSGQKNTAGKIKIQTKDYRTILDAAGDGIFLHDLNRGETIAVNEKAREMIGHPPENHPFTALPFIKDGEPPCTPEAALHHLKKAAAGEPRIFEWMTKDHNGRPSRLEVSLKRSLIGDRASVLVSVRDITQQKGAQTALKESEEQYRTIFENTGAATVILEEDATISLANSEFERLSGFTLEEIEGQKKWTEFVVREDLDKMLESSRIRRVDRNAAPKRYEFRFIDRQGRIKDIFLSIDMIPGTKKSVASLLDITNRKHAEEALRESEKKYRELVENANSIILRRDRSGNVTFFNEFAQRFFGYSEEEILGKNVVGTIVPERESTGRDLKGLIEDIARNPERYANNVNENMRRDGKKVWIAWTNKPVRDENGRVMEMLCIGNDITERKKAEEALKKSGEQLRRITDNMVDLVIQIDKEAIFQYLTPSVTRLLGYSVEEMLGKCAFDFIHRDNRPAAIEAFQQVMKRGRGTVKLQLRHKEGHYLWMDLLGDTVAGENGRIDGIIVGCRDITKRKKIEEALRESQRQLADIIEFLPDATLVIDREGRVIAWNRAIEKMTGVKAPDMLGKGNYEYSLPFYGKRRPILIDLALIPAEEMEPEYTTIQRSGDTIFGEAFTPALPPGDVHLSATASILRNSKGEIVGAIECIRDDTERMQAETKSQDMLNFMQTLLNTIPNPIFYKNTEGRYVGCNRACEAFLGLNREDIVGKSVYDLYPRDLADKYHEMDGMLFRQPGEQIYEWQFPHADGTIRDVIFNKATFSHADGSTAGLVAVIVDITERKRIEDELRDSQKRLSDIIDFLPAATLVIDREGRVIAWNRAMETMTGVKAPDMLGKGNYEYTLPFYGERRPILVDLALNPNGETEKKYVAAERHDQVLSGEAYMPALRGGEVYLHGTASILRDSKGHIAGAIETILDITERRQAEEALARAEEKYRGIFENAVEGIFQVTPEGRLISANPAFARIFGDDSPEEMQKTITKAYRQLGIDPKHRAKFLRLVEEQGLVQDYEIQALRKNDGHPVWLSVNMRAVRNDRDRTMYYEGTVQDISERKLLESRLLQAQKMEAIGTLAGGIAHDFNNILAAIMGYTEITKNKLKQAELHRHLEQVLNACERARNLVSQILTFSRQQDKEMKPVDMVPLVKETLQLLRAAIPTTVEIRPRISPKVHTVLADPTQIHQVIVNLCTNAAHSMRHKGGVLGIGLDRREVTAWNKDLYPDLRPGPYVELTISDTGTGIEQAIIHRIFDPFFTTKDKGEGTGLGLSVVYGIVKEHGGTITVQSEPGAGSMFRVCLPATEPEGKLKADSGEAIPGDGERILFVDDEEIISEIGKEILEELGYRVISTTSSTKALEIFRAHSHRFDLIITDMTMPGMTGLDLAREILGIQPDIPMILCTGFNEFIHEEDVLKLGIKALLLKPFSVKDFAAVIHRVLDESKDPGKTS